MIKRMNGSSRFNIYKLSEELGLRNMKKVIGKRYDFAVDALFYFESVQRFQYSGDMFSLGVPVTARAVFFFAFTVS